MRVVIIRGGRMNHTKQQGLVGRARRDLLLPIVLKRAAHPEEMAKMAWMCNHQIDWPQRAAV